MTKTSKWFRTIMNIIIRFKILNDLESKDQEEDFFSRKTKIELTPKITLNPKMMSAIKNLQASYDEDATKTVKQAD